MKLDKLFRKTRVGLKEKLSLSMWTSTHPNLHGVILTSARVSNHTKEECFWSLQLMVSLGFRVNSWIKHYQWLRQISMKLPLRKSALKFTKGSKRENSISYYFLLFWFNQNSISVLKTLLSCLSEKTLWKVDSESLYRNQGCMKSRYVHFWGP